MILIFSGRISRVRLVVPTGPFTSPLVLLSKRTCSWRRLGFLSTQGRELLWMCKPSQLKIADVACSSSCRLMFLWLVYSSQEF